MKKLLTCIAALAFAAPSFAQWSTSGNNTLHANTGNVGIGTSSPNEKFEVHGAAIFGGNNNLDGQNLSYLANSAKLLISWNRTGGAGETDFISNQGPGSLGGFAFYNFNNNSQLSQLMWIKGDGNVGIGTNNPLSKFHVKLENEFSYLQRPATSNYAGHYYVTGPDNNISYGFFAGLRENSSNYHIYNGQRNENVLTIRQDNSFVGINTSSPDAELAVRGTIHSQEVKVDVNVPAPDYVFAKGYSLTPLETVSRYIVANKHLPEIPAAKTMEKDGVNLSEMNMKLLKKVEELTLYLIEHNKQLKNLQKQITRQQMQMKSKPERIHSSNR